MNTWTIIYYTVLRNLRDYKVMAALTVSPIMLMLIIGSALDGEFSPKRVEAAKAGYLSEDKGAVSEQFAAYLQSDEIRGVLQVQEISKLEDGLRMVQSKEIDSLIHIPADASKGIAAGDASLINVYGGGGYSAVKPVVEAFVRMTNTSQAIVSLGTQIQLVENKSSIQDMPITTAGLIPRGIDYYAVATLFQSLLIGGVLGVLSMTRDTASYTSQRTVIAPVKRYELLIGRIAGNALTLFSAAVAVFLISKFAFQVNWNGNTALILVALFLFSVISVSLGILLFQLTNSLVITVLLMTGLMLIFTLASGGFSHQVSPLLEAIGWFTPSFHAQQTIFQSIYGGASSIVRSSGSPILYLIIYTAVVLSLIRITDRRRAG
ncbi:hypothetical protein PAECIP111893_01768 [Paenibacillus plantiphilus]|uniref:ABC-2 type transporter transmembrane domain-containing protein n=1 Tax=Paenibacillus plantiphilus TaxID=2905650 RepID=A0ABM9C2Z2_9BACL|nr:ABC transporter permease [Paenibacillus plantiphilus]CAH1201913.1 hypothetical protein PAECIP111893_01768 [Paenibacillus plantiphilus]